MISSTGCSTYTDQQIQSFMNALMTVLPRPTMPNTPEPSPLTMIQPMNHPTFQQSPEAMLPAFRQILNWNSAGVGSVQSNPSSYHSDSTRPRRVRPKRKSHTVYTTTQLNILNARFEQSNGITRNEQRSLAISTGLTEKQVRTWFQNERFKARREELKKANSGEELTP